MSGSEVDDHECDKCGKTFSTKYTLARHKKNIHRKRPKESESESEEPEVEEESDEEEEEPTNHIWRRLLKRVLREWNSGDEHNMPRSEEELMEVKDSIREDLYKEVSKVLNDYHDLVHSPMYKKIIRTQQRMLKLFGDEDDDDDDDTFETAFNQRSVMLNDFLNDNSDIYENYEESSDEDADDEDSDEDDE